MDFSAPTGGWQTFDVVPVSLASAGVASPTISFPVTSALYEIQGSATSSSAGTAAIGYRDTFTLQVVLPDGTQLNAGTQTLANSFFEMNTGVKRFRKPWVIGATQVITINVTNVTSSNLVLYLNFTVLQLELGSAVQKF